MNIPTMQITVSFVLYGYETWCLIVREERRLEMFQKQYAEEDIGPKNYKTTECWIKLHAEELYDLVLSPDIIKVIQTGRCDDLGMLYVLVEQQSI